MNFNKDTWPFRFMLPSNDRIWKMLQARIHRGKWLLLARQVNTGNTQLLKDTVSKICEIARFIQPIFVQRANGGHRYCTSSY